MEERSAPIFTVSSAKGGVGKTVFAVNFAFALHQETRGSVLLLDMNSIFCGDVSHAAGISPFVAPTGRSGRSGTDGIIDLLTNINAISPRVLLASVAPTYEGVTILSLRRRGEERRQVSIENISTFLDVVSHCYDQIIIDLGSGYSDPVTLACLERSNGIFVLLQSEMLSIAQSINALSALQQLSIRKQMIYPILNGYSNKSEFSPSIIETRIQRDLFAVIPADELYFATAVKVNQPAIVAHPRNAISKALGALAAKLWKMDLCEPQVVGVAKVKAPSEQQDNKSGLQQLSKDKSGGVSTEAAELDEIKIVIHQKLFEELDLKVLNELALKSEEERQRLRDKTKAVIDRLVDQEAVEITERSLRRQISQEVMDEALGLGPLESLLADSSISEIMCNGSEQIYVEKEGHVQLSSKRFLGEKYLRSTIDRIAGHVGRRIDEMSPMVDARLEDGSRVNAVIPPLSADGCLLTIRKFSQEPLGIDDLIGYGSMTWQMAELLKLCVESKLNIIISGGTGSGKTTLLNVLSSFIPENERIVTIEDATELQLNQDHVCRLESRPPNIEGKGEVTIRDLVRNSLRMRPDRIVVGECRGGEAIDMLQAMNTGHDGSMTTVHANNIRGAIRRLETLVMFSGLELPSRAIREQIASACDIIIQQNRQPDGSRKVVSISEITGIEEDVITTQEIFGFRQFGYDENQKIAGQYIASGLIPDFISGLESSGVDISREIFM